MTMRDVWFTNIVTYIIHLSFKAELLVNSNRPTFSATPFSGKEYKSNIFLDCCGLVRRALLDLRKDFGFRIGPWNQAYMLDTLPLEIEEENMQPGDLVFISGIYFNKSCNVLQLIKCKTFYYLKYIKIKQKCCN